MVRNANSGGKGEGLMRRTWIWSSARQVSLFFFSYSFHGALDIVRKNKKRRANKASRTYFSAYSSLRPLTFHLHCQL